MYFLQLSDTHHLADYQPNPDRFHDCFLNLSPLEDKLSKLAQTITKPLDFICHCGDLTHAGETEDYREVAQSFQKFFPIPLLVTAGNHDQLAPLQTVFLGEISSPFCYERQMGELRVLSVDNSNGRQNTGEMTDAICQWLLDKLRQKPQQDTIIMCHHHVIATQSGMPIAKTSPLFDQILSMPHLKAILTGHTHTPFQGVLQGVPYYTVGSMCFRTNPLENGEIQVQESCAYHLFRYENGQLTLVEAGDVSTHKPLGILR